MTTPAQVVAAVDAARRAGRTSVLMLVKRGAAPEAFVGIEIGSAANAAACLPRCFRLGLRPTAISEGRDHGQPAAIGNLHRHRRRQAADSRAQARQPPRADRRRDRHRQDRHPAGHRRRAVGGRRPDLRRRREGRPRRARHARQRRPPRPTKRSPPAPPRSAIPTGNIATIRCSSGICSASRAIRSAPRSARWGRCCSPG